MPIRPDSASAAASSGVVGPALEEDRPDDGALDRSAHPLPVDRRPGVEELVVAEAERRRGPAGRRRASAGRRGGARRAVAFAAATVASDRIVRVVLEPGEEQARAPGRPRRAAASRGAATVAPLAASGRGEHLEADVHGAHAVREQRPTVAASVTRGLRPARPRRPTIRAAIRAALALLGARTTPAAASRSSWAPRPCGSPAVPHTDATTTNSRPSARRRPRGGRRSRRPGPRRDRRGRRTRGRRRAG